MEDRTHKTLDPDKDITYIADCYHAWRGESVEHPVFKEGYKNIPGFCKSTRLEEVKEHGYVLTPGRYVGAELQEDDGEAFTEKMQRLTAQLAEQMKQAQAMDEEIKKQLARIGFKL
jgi:type I restriction enzyme M protein